MLGITDGISYVAKGVANEVGAKFITVGKKRPQRAFTRSSGDSSVLVLSNFDLGAARAQRFVLNNARKKKLKDTFICLASIDETSLLIFSDNYIFWVKEEEVIWHSAWKNVQCALLAQPIVEIVLRDGERVRVTCRGESRCLKLYDAFVQNANKVANPEVMFAIGMRTSEATYRASQMF